MPCEISCRMSHAILQYVQRLKPEALPFLLEGFKRRKLAHEQSWLPMETMELLCRRVETIFNRENILLEIGLQSLNWVGQGRIGRLLAIRAKAMPGEVFRCLRIYASYFLPSQQVLVHKQAENQVEIEVRLGAPSRGICQFLLGWYQALLRELKVRDGQVIETQCAVPIWKKGILDGYRFVCEDNQIYKYAVLTGNKENIGALPDHQLVHYGQTVFGTPACFYRLSWKPFPLWHRGLEWFRPWFLSGAAGPLLEAQEAQVTRLERQLRRLQRRHSSLLQALEERTLSSRALEKKVNTRTLELEDMVLQLKELDEMKSYFLSITSHELRTPLTIIKGALNLLLSDGDKLPPDRYQKYLLMARNNADHLNTLISNLLDLSRLESGQLKLELEKVDMVRLVRESAEAFRELAERNSLDFRCEVSGGSHYLTGDAMRLRQIVDNLLANAMKFTPAGGSIVLRLEDKEDFKVISVSDTGIGIAEWERKRIFEKFQQAERSLTRETAGVGLGLAIVKDLVELHEGSIHLQSEKGKGTLFIIVIPKSGPKDPKHGTKHAHHNGQEPPILLGGK